MPAPVRSALAVGAMLVSGVLLLGRVDTGVDDGGAGGLPQVPAHQSHMLDLGERMTEAVEWGVGDPPIVMIHGANGTPHMFDDFAAHFAHDHRVVAYARRGHGKATPPSEPFDEDDLVEDLETVMDVLGLERAVLMGHSFAGAELTRFAALHPDRVAALVYLDAHHEMNENALYVEAMADPIYPECALGMESRDDFRRCLQDYIVPPLPWTETMDEVVADMLVDTPGPPVYKTAAEHVEPSMMAVMTGYRREYERIRAPTLFVMSETYLTVETADEEWNRRYAEWVESSGYEAAQAWWVEHIREAMPHARIVTIEGGTHDFITEFDQTVAEVDRFLREIR